MSSLAFLLKAFRGRGGDSWAEVRQETVAPALTLFSDIWVPPAGQGRAVPPLRVTSLPLHEVKLTCTHVCEIDMHSCV